MLLANYTFKLNCRNILLLTALILIIISPFDKDWTFWLSRHRIDGFADIFNRSMFEGKMLGVSDLGVFVYLGSLLLLVFTQTEILTLRNKKASLFSSFLCYYGLFLGIGFVHPLKLIWGRKRPEALLGIDDASFTQWYQGGISTFEKINFAGSFPSGHTATCLLIIALIYCSYFLKPSTKFRKIILITGYFGFSACVAMGVSRSMTLKHWISDWIFSIGFGWFLLHYLFFHIWKMDRLLTEKTNNEHLKRPKTSLLISMPLVLIAIIFSLRLASNLWA